MDEQILPENVPEAELSEGGVFGEEFDYNDLVESNPEAPIGKAKDIDLESILNYSDDERREKSFLEQFNMSQEDLVDDDMIRAQKQFRDFLIAPKISGAVSGVPDSFYYPAEIVLDRRDSVEISDIPNNEINSHEQTSILVNKKENGDIESIEIYCKCGEKTTIVLNSNQSE